MYPQSKRDEYFDKAKKLAEAKARRKALLKKIEEREQAMVAIPRQRTISDHARFDALKRAVSLLKVGGIYPDHYVPEGCEDMIGPGLHDVDIDIARLERECAELHAHIERWPTPETTHPYRYVRPYVRDFDGKELKPGDVVELTEARAKNLVNIFEAV